MTEPDRPALLSRLADAAITLAADGVWEEIGLPAIARAAGSDLVSCARARIDRARVREELERRLDQAMLAAASADDAGSSARDRLFEALMGRYDALEANRAGWTSILVAETGQSPLGFARAPRRAISARWALEAAGIVGSGLEGAARVAGLVRVVRRCDESWLQDGPDLARTMRALDGQLRDGQSALVWLRRATGGLSGLSEAAREAWTARRSSNARADTQDGDGDGPVLH